MFESQYNHHIRFHIYQTTRQNGYQTSFPTNGMLKLRVMCRTFRKVNFGSSKKEIEGTHEILAEKVSFVGVCGYTIMKLMDVNNSKAFG